jgi:hypothetical protein
MLLTQSNIILTSNFDLSVGWDTSSVGCAATFPSRGRLGLSAGIPQLQPQNPFNGYKITPNDALSKPSPRGEGGGAADG